MEDYFMTRSHVPPFGSWDSGDYLQLTDCFDSAREAEFLQYTTAYQEQQEDDADDLGDLYVTGDLYHNDVVTPTLIIVPRSRSKPKQGKQQSRRKPGDPSNWPRQHNASSPVKTAKPVDEDLYRISPELLYKNAKKKRGFGFFASCCIVPTCVM